MSDFFLWLGEKGSLSHDEYYAVMYVCLYCMILE
jgi:hypothetical protein